MKYKNRRAVRYILICAALTLVPLLLAAAGLTYLLYRQTADSARERAARAQASLLFVLRDETRGISLQLSRLMSADQGSIIGLAERTAQAEGADFFSAYGLLQRHVDNLLDPSADIASFVFYFSDDTELAVKGSVLFDAEEVKAQEWYKAAVSRPGKAQFGVFADTEVPLSRAHLYAIAAYAPKAQQTAAVSRLSGGIRLESIVLFFRSQAEQALAQLDEGGSTDRLCVVSPSARLLAANGNTEHMLPDGGAAYDELFALVRSAPARAAALDYTRDGARCTCVVGSAPDIPWRVLAVLNWDEVLRPFYALLWIVCLLAAAAVCAFAVCAWIFARGVIAPLGRLKALFAAAETTGLPCRAETAGLREIRELQESFNGMAQAVAARQADETNLRHKLFEAEYRALRAQINPQFLVNMLNSLRFMAQVSKFDSLKNMAEALICILSASFRGTSSFWTIQEEIELLQSYTYLMKIRYSDCFDVAYEIAEGCLSCLIPRMTLQPILENSIVHGFDTLDVPGLITVRIFKDNDNVCIEIADNGGSLEQDDINEILSSAVDMDHWDYCRMGLWNTNNRLKMHYGSGFGVTITGRSGESTSTLIRVPYRAREAQHV